MLETKTKTPNLLGSLVNLAVPITALVGIISLQVFWPPEDSPLKEKVVLDSTDAVLAEQKKALQLNLLKASPTFGFDNLIADWVFLQFLQYFGDDAARNETGFSLSEDYFDIITRLDPRWVDIYLFLSNSLSIYEAKPKVAIEYMTRGTNVLSPEIDPKAWQVWRFKGMDQLLLAGDIPGAIRSHEMAAEWTDNTSYQEFSSLFRNTAEFLKTDPDSKLIKFNAWLWVYYQTRDSRVQERAQQEIIKLGGKVEITETGEKRFVLPDAAK
ncbi:MAG: hypothetical protein F6K40_29875 [Okeania sp. SIO3I5]|uniref:hypothetical protein n=1 Tax=Okeania sp. SIO3I5 TaxID=2607805 RepID=UPI0013BD3A4A|nr:hypothetical protein [Okeania sp. SIO3I5]NEQ40227.1 hypothetical protein [Okeania sp. SIO3I5]